MKSSLDCIPCFLRQALEAARLDSSSAPVHERVLRDVLRWTAEMDWGRPAPVATQHIHRQIRVLTGVADPYRNAKDQQNRMALALLPELKALLGATADPLMTAVRLAIAGNVIDLGAKADVTEADVRGGITQVLSEPLIGDPEAFCQAVAKARRILYLADNAGEIAFDRLLIEQLSPACVTVAVRGAPVINDATMADARAVGLHDLVEVIDNGSDAPSTLLDNCSQEFRRRFAAAEVIIAKGQGNYEALSDGPDKLFFLFKAKCFVVANHLGVPVGAHVLARGKGRITGTGGV